MFKFKKMFLIMGLLLVFCIGTSSAADNNTTEKIVLDGFKEGTDFSKLPVHKAPAKIDNEFLVINGHSDLHYLSDNEFNQVEKYMVEWNKTYGKLPAFIEVDHYQVNPKNGMVEEVHYFDFTKEQYLNIISKNHEKTMPTEIKKDQRKKVLKKPKQK